MTTFYLLRHGETEANRTGLVCGTTDSSLTSLGARQLEEVGIALRTTAFDVAYISALKRGTQSADAFCRGFGREIPVETVSNLREIDYGEYEGVSKDIYAAAKKDFFADHPDIDGLAIGVGKGAESYKEASERFSNALLDIAKKNTGKNVLLINHSGNIRSLILTEKIIVPQEVFDSYKKGDVSCGDVLVFESDGKEILFKNFFHAL